jgi:hypothetical protein
MLYILAYKCVVTAGYLTERLFITVEPLITHTPRWTAQGMGYQGL